MQFRSSALAASLFAASLSFISVPAGATSLEDQMKGLEASVQTIEQRRKASLRDMQINVLQAYRDAMVIDSVETRVGEVFDRTARIEVAIKYSFDFEKARAVRANLSKYFSTNTDKESGVEPYGRIYTNFDDCVGAYCAVKQEMKHFLQWSGVGINATFLGLRGTESTLDRSGHFELHPGKVTFQFDVPKSKIKGDPKPVVTAQVFDFHFCPGDSECGGNSYTVRKSLK